jgi:lactoylglutathione lyase
MVRAKNLEESLDFYCNGLGLVETRRREVPEGKFTLVFLAAPEDVATSGEAPVPELEITHNWDSDERLDTGRSWGHLAYRVDNIYETCQRLMDMGVTINRPPGDGHMAFVKSPDNVSIELLQKGAPLPPEEPWSSMEKTGSW